MLKYPLSSDNLQATESQKPSCIQRSAFLSEQMGNKMAKKSDKVVREATCGTHSAATGSKDSLESDKLSISVFKLVASPAVI